MGILSTVRDKIGWGKGATQAPAASPSPQPPPSPSTPGPSAPDPSHILSSDQRYGPAPADGSLNLVNYTPEQLMQHVETTLSTVHFGMTRATRFKEAVAEFWSVFGPWVLLAGTAGEVFAFIWGYSDNPAWWVGLSILATVIVLEATFMVVSYKSETIRNRAETRVGGPTDLDRAKLTRYKTTWYVLGFGVGSGQVAFLIAALNAKMGNLIMLVIFAGVRTVMTLAADYYVAFIHEEHPTEAEQAERRNEQRAQAAQRLLRQKTQEVTIINDGNLALQQAHAEAEIKQDNMQTELTMKRLENQNRIATLQSMQEQATMFNRMGQTMIRAIFDPEMPDEDRQKMLQTMQALMQNSHLLPSPHIDADDSHVP